MLSFGVWIMFARESIFNLNKRKAINYANSSAVFLFRNINGKPFFFLSCKYTYKAIFERLPKLLSRHRDAGRETIDSVMLCSLQPLLLGQADSSLPFRPIPLQFQVLQQNV